MGVSFDPKTGNIGWASSGLKGPASSTDNAIARWDGTTGKLVQDSSVTLTDLHNIEGLAGILGRPNTSLDIYVDDSDDGLDGKNLTLNAGYTDDSAHRGGSILLLPGDNGDGTQSGYVQFASNNPSQNLTIFDGSALTADRTITLPDYDSTIAWSTDSPGIKYPGHIAVGANAGVDGTGQYNSYLQDIFGVGTVQSPLLLQETATGTPSFYNIGLGIKYGANFTGNVGGLIGNENTTAVVSGNNSNVTIAVGHYNTFIHRGTGTIGTVYGQADGVHNQSTGTITTAYAMFAQAVTNTGGGSIGTIHGLLVEPQTVASNNYGVTIGGASTNTLWLDYTADSTTASKGIVFGASKDTNLYRSAAGRLRTDSRLDVAGAQLTLAGSTTALRQTASDNANNDVLTAIVSGDSYYRLQVLTSGKMNWGNGSSAVDTNLYRSAADTLMTDDSFVVGGSYISAPYGTAATPGVLLGDVGIYRYAANNLGISTAGTLRWRVASNGTLYPGATATYDIGDYFTRVNAAYIGTVYNNGGTAAAPGSSIPNATDAGMYYSSSTLGLSVGGVGFITGHATNGVNVAPSGGKLGFFTTTPVVQQTGDVATALETYGLMTDATYPKRTITVVLDGGGSTLTTGAQKVYVSVPYTGTIKKWRILALDGNTGDITLDIWKDTYANFAPTDADSITASAQPSISSSNKNESSTLTGWTTTVTEGDILEVNIDSVTTFTKVKLELFVEATS